MDIRKICAGMTTYQRPASEIELAARAAAETHFGFLESLTRQGSAYRRGYEHAAFRHHDFRGGCPHYDAGFGAGLAT